MPQAQPVEREVVSALHKALNVPVWYSDDKGYLARSFEPDKHSSVSSLRSDLLVFSFLRKWKGLDAGINLEEATFNSWRAAESACAKTNKWLEERARAGFDPATSAFILSVQRKISHILGRLNVNSVSRLCRHGPGATFDLRHGSTPGKKLLSKPSITHAALSAYLRIIDYDLFRTIGDDFELVRGNRAVMVPKSAKINRMISAEPTLNTFVQQGAGRLIRERLKRAGVDLNDQTINQRHAFHALADGLATIDLSMASDTLSYNLVKLLLPRDWFEFLDSLRSPLTLWKGRWYHNQKFSSMGNSYTFELESLIFFALLSVALQGRTVSVYGDDIIVEQRDFDLAVATLQWAGFSPNAEKSFSHGSRFFESCGKQYFDLEDVTPPYQKDICRVPQDYVRLHNRLYRAGLRLGLLTEIRAVCQLVEKRFRQRFRNCPVAFGPELGDDRWFINHTYDWKERDRVKLLCLIEIPRLSAVDSRREEAYYFYKLRRPENSNIHPKGWVAEQTGAKYAFVMRTIWRSSQTG